MRYLFIGVLIGAIAIASWVYVNPRGGSGNSVKNQPSGTAIVAVTMPELTGSAALGGQAFAAFCAACHGNDAGGIDGKGPPLIHKIYEPGHHGDEAFVRAAKFGVRSHHWRFGDMPPVEGVTDADIKAIIAYIRSVQEANGIF